MSSFSDLYQKVGLATINAVARSVPSHVTELRFGELPRQTLDWYQLGGEASRPTVVFFYGGGWRSGRKQDYRFVADTLMNMGFNVIVPDYRLFPHVQFSDILADAKAVMALVMETVTIDVAAPMFLMGHSAGAQIASLLTLNRELTPAPDSISGFVGLAGPYDFFPFTEDDHWHLFGPEPAYPESQAVNYVRADAPPLYLLHGEEDRRVKRGHSKSLMEKQQATGGTATREVYPAMGHVDIIVEFSRFHRGRSQVVSDVSRFLAAQVSAVSSSMSGK